MADHGTIKGSQMAARINRDPNFWVIPASEIRTEYGDIVALFISHEITERRFVDVCASVKEQGGLVVVPHPYGKHSFFSEDVIERYADMVEIFNARARASCNREAMRTALRYDKAFSACSDAHSYFEIGRGYITLNQPVKSLADLKTKLLEMRNGWDGKLTPYYLSHGYTFLCKKVKKFL